MTRARAVGTAWNTRIVDALTDAGFPFVERRALNGANDKGDVVGIPGWVIEAKACKRLEFASWIAEAEVERVNANAEFAVVWAKRKGKASAADGYVVMSGAQFVALLRVLEEVP